MFCVSFIFLSELFHSTDPEHRKWMTLDTGIACGGQMIV